jgi:hypothetical protein
VGSHATGVAAGRDKARHPPAHFYCHDTLCPATQTSFLNSENTFNEFSFPVPGPPPPPGLSFQPRLSYGAPPLEGGEPYLGVSFASGADAGGMLALRGEVACMRC